MHNRNYAYGVMVEGKKRFGGTIHADTMEQAAIGAAQVCKLTIEITERYFIGPDVNWMCDGKKASLFVWAPPEYFQDKGITSDRPTLTDKEKTDDNG